MHVLGKLGSVTQAQALDELLVTVEVLVLQVAKELAALKEEDRLYAEPTSDAKAAPDYAGGTSVYMLIKTKDYDPNSQF